MLIVDLEMLALARMRAWTSQVLLPFALLASSSAWSQALPAVPSASRTSLKPRGPDRLLQAGHTGSISVLAVSRDGHWLASGGYDKTVIIWDMATGREQARLTHRGEAITQIAFSPDGVHLAASRLNGVIEVWDYQNKSVAYSRKIQASSGLTYSSDGRFWVAARGPEKEDGNSTIEVHDAGTGDLVRTIAVPRLCPEKLLVTSDGLLIAATPDDNEGDGMVQVWNFATGEPVKTYASGADAISADGHLTARIRLETDPKQIIISSVATGKEIRRFQIGNPGSVFFSSDGSKVAVTDPGPQGALTVWSLGSGAEIKLVPSDKSEGSSGLATAVFTPDGKSVLAAPYSDHSIKLWDATGGRELRTFLGQSSAQGIAFSPDGHTLAVGSSQGLQFWDLASSTRTRILDAGRLNFVVYSPDGRWIATNSGTHFAGEHLKIWEVASGALAADFSFDTSGSPVSWIAFTRNSTLPLTTLNLFTKAWRFTANEGIHTVWSGSAAIAISPDEKLLVAQSGTGGNIDVWDMTQARKIATISAHKMSVAALAFSSDGKWLVTGGQEMLATDSNVSWSTRIWDTANWTEQTSLSFLTKGARCAVFSPDARLVAVEKSWDVIDLIPVGGGVPLASFEGTDSHTGQHQFTPENLAFSPDGTMLAQGAPQGIRIWKIPPSLNRGRDH